LREILREFFEGNLFPGITIFEVFKKECVHNLTSVHNIFFNKNDDPTGHD